LLRPDTAPAKHTRFVLSERSRAISGTWRKRIARPKPGITADTPLRLSKLFGHTAEFRLNLQARYDIETASFVIASVLKAIMPLKRDAA
jgi:plasmid maintenance system antidote protein VapI